MKIAILGNGKMGKRIGELAQAKGDEIVLVSSSKVPATTLNLSIADVAIDFSTPNSAFENISHAINNGIPVISGTTGWSDKLKEIEQLCTKKEGAFLYASNFSLGMNIFFQINKQVAELAEVLALEKKSTAEREENVVGTHSVIYSSAEDEIEIKHIAKNRDGFAIGALIAAKWILGKKGIFSMKDVLKIQ